MTKHVTPFVRLRNPDAILVHIPKTGGSSIRYGLWDDPGVPTNWIPTEHEWVRYPSIAVIRHPFERFVSAYDDFTKNRNFDLSMKEFFEIGIQDIDFTVQKDPKAKIKRHILPYSNPYFGLHNVSHRINFDNYQKELTEFQKEIGIEDRELPHLRPSKGSKNWKVRLTWSMECHLRRYYEEDLRIYTSLFS